MVNVKMYGKLLFFDRSVIRTNWRAINESPLKYAGLLVRRIARGSIRRRPRYGPPSPVGTPPRSRRPGSTPPFKMIYSIPNMLATSVMIGMVWFGSHPPVPGLHEHGGRAKRRIGRIVGWRGGNVNRRPLKEFETVSAVYPARPFMYPALLKAAATGKIPSLWRHSWNRAA